MKRTINECTDFILYMSLINMMSTFITTHDTNISDTQLIEHTIINPNNITINQVYTISSNLISAKYKIDHFTSKKIYMRYELIHNKLTKQYENNIILIYSNKNNNELITSVCNNYQVIKN